MSVFPARAGMSPVVSEQHSIHIGVPRASGDEPVVSPVWENIRRCSPRERG